MNRYYAPSASLAWQAQGFYDDSAKYNLSFLTLDIQSFIL